MGLMRCTLAAQRVINTFVLFLEFIWLLSTPTV
jgi:hypothetical protein